MASGIDAEWWRGATLYQIYPLSFADSNGDGWGDLPGITARLDYVAGLGVDAIWLSPFYASNWADFGYDTIDHCAVDPRCGTLADFDALLERAHALGLRVIVDQVYTYTSSRHPWFLESRASPEGPRGDWYEWGDARPDGSPPTNWISIFGGPAWAWDLARRQYYMTHFLPQMPHLRVQNPAVQAALLDIGRFWLERGVDGFRMDVINLAVVDPQRRDNPPSGVQKPRLPIEAQQGLYDQSRPESIEFVRRIRALADERPGRFLMGEIGGWDRMRTTQAYTAGDRLLHSAYFVLGEAGGPLTPARLREELEAWSDVRQGWPTWSFSNHDLVRGPSRVGAGDDPRLARMLVALLVAARGTALLYQGDELGLPDGQVPFDRLRDPATLRFHPHFLQRDGARTPMPWRAEAFAAGFSSAEPWLPLGRGHAALAVDRQELDPHSTLKSVRQLLRLRREHRALRHGELSIVEAGEQRLALERTLQTQRLRCIFNVSAGALSLAPTELQGARILAASGLSQGTAGDALDAWGFCIASLS
jgi:alpha-glucosidase